MSRIALPASNTRPRSERLEGELVVNLLGAGPAAELTAASSGTWPAPAPVGPGGVERPANRLSRVAALPFPNQS